MRKVRGPGRGSSRAGAVAAAAAISISAVASAAGATAAPSQSAVDGIWQMDGYGTVLAIGHGYLRSFETTAVSCLPELTATQVGTSGPDGTTAFTDRDGDQFTMRPQARPGHGVFDIPGSVGDRHLRKIPALPARCGQPTPSDPLAIFDVFWETYEENYPFFAAKGIDWQQVRNRYRPQVTPTTTDAELFTILSAMIAPLNDAHTILSDGQTVVYHSRPGTVLPLPAYDQRIKDYIRHRDVTTGWQDFANGKISYADLPGSLGYLRISGFAGYTAADTYASNSAELQRTLDTILTPARTQGPGALKGLIIDVRVNSGGSDALGLQVAARLTGRPYIAYAKRTRDDPGNPAVFTTPQPILIRPACAPVYQGRVALLTGGSTVSAGETFTQALMNRTPGVTRIGGNTQGVFSDVLYRVLPNGWSFGLPNEEYLNAHAQTFDGNGIAPDIRTPVFTSAQFARNLDSAFDRAVSLLDPEGAV